MPVYIVRRASNHGLLGIFSVRDIECLTDQIRNCAEPEDCEFCEIDAGGILWPAIDGRKIPAEADEPDTVIDEIEDQEDPNPLRLLAGAVLTESWQEAFYEESHSWQRVPVIAQANEADV